MKSKTVSVEAYATVSIQFKIDEPFHSGSSLDLIRRQAEVCAQGRIKEMLTEQSMEATALDIKFVVIGGGAE